MTTKPDPRRRTITAKVTYTTGAYIARGGGKSCSSTTSNHRAVRGLADKLGFSVSADVVLERQIETDKTVFKIVEV